MKRPRPHFEPARTSLRADVENLIRLAIADLEARSRLTLLGFADVESLAAAWQDAEHRAARLIRDIEDYTYAELEQELTRRQTAARRRHTPPT